MAQLVVRKLDPKLVHALKRRAAEHGCSAEAEHRQILKTALNPAAGPDFWEFLAQMPYQGDDDTFAGLRSRQAQRSRVEFEP